MVGDGNLRRAVTTSPLGPLTLLASDAGLVRLRPQRWRSSTGHADAAESVAAADDAVLGATIEQLSAYFGGELTEFTVPLDLTGASPFTTAVLTALREVPYGSVVSYGELARRIGRPTAARAVGGACNRNPLPVIVPCHRVLAADGGLGGFAGGLEAKRELLAGER